MGEQTPELPLEQHEWAKDLIGAVLDDRYRVDRLLGSGGMGAVYLGEQTVLRKSVAIKVLRPEYAHREIYVRRFLREARAASKIAHRHVVEVTDFGQAEGGRVYFVMEHLQGQDLAKLVRGEGMLSWPRARLILLQMVRALKAAHAKGIIHRDIKPANVFLVRDDDDDTDFVKVLDFGIAKVVEPDESSIDGLTNSNQMMGTAMYMAPEQALGRGVDARSDIYALGAVAYQLLTGRMPFDGANAFEVLMKRVNEPPPTLRKYAPDLAPAVEDLVRRAMAREPAARYQSMAEIEAALSEIPASAEASAEERQSAAPAAGEPSVSAAPATMPALDTPVSAGVEAETQTSSRHARLSPPADTESAPPLPDLDAPGRTQQALIAVPAAGDAPRRRSRWPWALGAALVVGVAAFGAWRWRAEQRPAGDAVAANAADEGARAGAVEANPAAPAGTSPLADDHAAPSPRADDDAPTAAADAARDEPPPTPAPPAASPEPGTAEPTPPPQDRTKPKPKPKSKTKTNPTASAKPNKPSPAPTVGAQISRLTAAAKRKCGGEPGGTVSLRFLVDGTKAGLLEVTDTDQPAAVVQCVRRKFSGATFVGGTHGLRTAVVRF